MNKSDIILALLGAILVVVGIRSVLTRKLSWYGEVGEELGSFQGRNAVLLGLLAACLGGFLVGSSFDFLREHLDDSTRSRSFEEEMTDARRTPDANECIQLVDVAERAAERERSTIPPPTYFSRKADIEGQRSSCLAKSGRYGEAEAAWARRNDYLNQAVQQRKRT